MDATAQAPRRFDLGGCAVTLVDGGQFKLDGGAMFGLIPKPVWTRTTPADDQNRIQLACNCLLVEWAGCSDRRLIIETGHGPKYGPKERNFFQISPDRWLLPSLRAAGIDPQSITDVAVSHLHFDHAGGLSLEQDGRIVATFPNARVHVQRQEYEDARTNYGIMTASYRPENLDPVEQAGGFNLLDGEAEFLPGVRALPAPGHTRGHQAILVTGADRSLIFAGDAMPTGAHLGPAYNMAYDLFPIENRATKWKLLHFAAQRKALLVIDHEPHHPVVTVVAEGDWFRLEPVAL
jgi:glyoxylase-like metal-dependent hydrolase (beta-lactamase superfamily II)